jgi:hypothetical protein
MQFGSHTAKGNRPATQRQLVDRVFTERPHSTHHLPEWNFIAVLHPKGSVKALPVTWVYGTI